MLERILQLMKEQGLNKNQLAIKANLPRTTVYSLLSSDKNCLKAKIETGLAVANALKTTLDYLIEDKCISKSNSEILNLTEDDTKALKYIAEKISKSNKEDVNK